MEDAKKRARKLYEESGRGSVVFRVQLAKNDSPSEWESIIDWLRKSGNGDAKEGLKNIAKEHRAIP